MRLVLIETYPKTLVAIVGTLKQLSFFLEGVVLLKTLGRSPLFWCNCGESFNSWLKLNCKDKEKIFNLGSHGE